MSSLRVLFLFFLFFICFVLKWCCCGYQSVPKKGYRSFCLVVGICQVPQRETVVRAAGGGRRMRRRPATAASSSNAGASLEGLYNSQLSKSLFCLISLFCYVIKINCEGI